MNLSDGQKQTLRDMAKQRQFHNQFSVHMVQLDPATVLALLDEIDQLQTDEKGWGHPQFVKQMCERNELLNSALTERDGLVAKYRKVLEWYADAYNWTTSDDEFHFIKVGDRDWGRANAGGFVGGKLARDALGNKE